MAGAVALGLVLLSATTGPEVPPSAGPARLEGVTPAAFDDIPTPLIRTYQQAAATCPGLPWTVLAGIGKVETDHDRATAVSSAGALGPMQFLPATWRAYGVDADGDGRTDVHDPVDATHGAAAYLCRNGGGDPERLWDAVWNYNHAGWYVERVLELAAGYGDLRPVPPGTMS
ncbi:hypothetical protein BH24ACT3_BH24ACT3_12620 [soil metagenome]